MIKSVLCLGLVICCIFCYVSGALICSFGKISVSYCSYDFLPLCFVVSVFCVCLLSSLLYSSSVCDLSCLNFSDLSCSGILVMNFLPILLMFIRYKSSSDNLPQILLQTVPLKRTQDFTPAGPYQLVHITKCM